MNHGYALPPEVQAALLYLPRPDASHLRRSLASPSGIARRRAKSPARVGPYTHSPTHSCLPSSQLNIPSLASTQLESTFSSALVPPPALCQPCPLPLSVLCSPRPLPQAWVGRTPSSGPP